MEVENLSNEGNGFKLVGHKNFVRNNPRSDKFNVKRFHHVEFWCGDATNTFKRFQHGLGMTLVAKSDQSTGNSAFASYVLRSGELVMTFTSPYAKSVAHHSQPGGVPVPHFDVSDMHQFIASHGLAVKAVGLVVGDAADAFHTSVKNGAIPALEPAVLKDKAADHEQQISEVKLYGDVVLRYVSGHVRELPYLAGYTAVTDAPLISYGLRRLDHAVGNVHNLVEATNYIMGFTGFHEFAEFTADDVGTVDSGLNSVVIANNNEYVLMPINEATFDTPRKSQIQTYLEQNEGPGLQHLALKTNDIITTLREMKARAGNGGFDFMPKPSAKYYRDLPQKVGGLLNETLLKECEELGVLVDKDDQGILLQIFTKPLGDRATVFLEIIQRVGCMPGQALNSTAISHDGPAYEVQGAGCGGFGKGNFHELFKRIEDYERTLMI